MLLCFGQTHRGTESAPRRENPCIRTNLPSLFREPRQCPESVTWLYLAAATAAFLVAGQYAVSLPFKRPTSNPFWFLLSFHSSQRVHPQG